MARRNLMTPHHQSSKGSKRLSGIQTVEDLHVKEKLEDSVILLQAPKKNNRYV
jgi:hypothetical protein